MAGHNKWSKIKRKKGNEDQKRSKLFSILAKTIAVEVKKAGGNRESPGIRQAIDKARATNMPNDNIERAIKNAQGGNTGTLEEVVYEAYGPGGVALIIEGITDNRNRTGQEIKHLLSKNGASLAAPGAAIWAFQKTDGKLTPTTTVEITEDLAQSLANLVDTLGENEDIKNIYTNATDFEI